MKQFTLLFLFFILLSATAHSQSFEDGLRLYEQQEYEEALEIFESLDDGQSMLFAGKSHFDLQNYLKANEYLRDSSENAQEVAYRQEAQYTLGLSHFRMKNYTMSIDILYDLITSDERGRARVDAQRFYRQILQYLTLEQRFRVIQTTEYLPVAKELVTSVLNLESDLNYKALVAVFLERINDEALYAEFADELDRTAGTRSSQNSYPTPPEGMVYNVGVVLPADEEEEQNTELLVPRNLYYGITLAAEEFNSQNSDKKISLNYRNSHQNADSTAKAFHDIVWKGFSDAVIGPLFSETAARMAGLSEKYRVPMIAPLANSDEINLDYNYTFQMNPTFEVHGKQMARHAVQRLGLDTLAVITPNNALGTASAQSFRREAERLGAYVSYYIEEDFASIGYDLTEFTEVFTTDPVLVDSLNYIPTQGIYAPFTGQAANTLVNLLMTDLEVLGSQMVILGSEEWQSANLSNWQERNFEIYFSQGFGEAADTSAVRFFEEDFQTRFGIEADQFSKLGYDIGTYLFESLSESGNPALLTNVLRTKETYDGFGIRIEMDNKRINQHVFIRPLTPKAAERFSNR